MLRAVIIDDESIGVNTLKLLIEKYTTGLTITGTATDPEEGIQLIEEERPQVVFLDISMPKMDGFEMLLQLKYRDFKVVFTTAYSEYAIQAIKNKAEDYLLKPIDISELKKCVHGLLGNSPAVPEKENKRLIELSVKDGIIRQLYGILSR
jgi:two-component system LytT family response regulator